MARVRRYIDTDVLTEAKRRLHHVMDTFDNWVVAFSGGKDSLAALRLVKEVQDERGDRSKVRALFRDEEFIPRGVVDFVTELRSEPWLDLEWWCVPQRATHVILGAADQHVAWDPERKWGRQPPPWALGAEDIGLEPGAVLSQLATDDLTIRNIRGKVAIITGVRAAESIMRYRSCVNKLHENYIVSSSSRRGWLVRPIYDWQENDVFRYFYDRSIRYCEVYDFQSWAGERLRVSTPMHAESSKRIFALAAHAPELWQQVLDSFPEMAVQARYYNELDSEGQEVRYADSWESIREWVDTFITDPELHARAVAELESVMTRAARVPESYPLPHVLKGFMTHGGKRVIQPMRPDDGAALTARHARKKARRTMELPADV